MNQSSALPDNLEQVAEFQHQVTGVAVSETGRIFVNFPRWTEDTAVSVAELGPDGQLKPYPNEEWNSWRNTKRDQVPPESHRVCVQSVVADGNGNLWVLDPAAPATERVVKGGPKLVQIDMASNEVAQVIAFDETVAPTASYLNDVRFSPDGNRAYITDSGQGAIVIVDLASGTAHRVLDGHPSTQPEKGVVVKTDGKELRRPDGRGALFAADGIALSPDGKFLYWQALTGHTLYRIATSALQDGHQPEDQLASKVETVGKVGVSDGYWMDSRGNLYLSALEENAIKLRKSDGSLSTLVQDERLRWPDSFAQGPDGAMYVTTSRIMDNAQYNPDAPPQLNTQLWRFPAAASS
ncbi:MAG TPA: L-dopachrome tautomerase-related protein [Hyphomicrobiaceae bacterium]|nr:L-dopachrome tautomerase-related protein [Hyphomicrobiaceae bacterium]